MTEMVVLVPTRSRPQNVEPILEAWSQTGAWGVADLVFIVDHDDMHIDAYEKVIGSHIGPKIVRMPEWQPLVPKLNVNAVEAAKQYPIVAFMGDDHIPRTRLWAHMLLEDHLTKRKLIWYGQDGFQDRNIPSWWSMSGDMIIRLGKMVPAPVQHLYCDNAVKVLGEEIDSIGYDERIMVEHMHPYAGKAKGDPQYERVNRAQQYERDGGAFHAWVQNGLPGDAKLLADLRR